MMISKRFLTAIILLFIVLNVSIELDNRHFLQLKWGIAEAEAATCYIWEKFNVVNGNGYSLTLIDDGGYSTSPDHRHGFYRGYGFNPSTGDFSLYEWDNNIDRGYYTENVMGTTYLLYSFWNVDIQISRSFTVSWSNNAKLKGSSTYTYVYDSDPLKYPYNYVHSDGYWYVYKGVNNTPSIETSSPSGNGTFFTIPNRTERSV